MAGDIKAGAGEEGQEDDARPKKHYAVQLALYTDILERRGLAAGRKPFVWDIRGDEVIYDLDASQGQRNPTTLWQMYQEALAQAQAIVVHSEETLPAYSAACKLCHWYTACLNDLEVRDDLTLLPDLGRSKRDVMVAALPTVDALAGCDPKRFIAGKKTAFRGIGPDTLVKFHERAKLVKAPTPRPYRTAPIALPSAKVELFFDIEVDPMRDHCYLHGFVERRDGENSTERYYAFLTEAVTQEEEERVFAEAWRLICERHPCAIYYYSTYERTIWRKLQQRFPSVCKADDIETLFASPLTVDLYDVIRKTTEWPTRDHSIKTIAKYLSCLQVSTSEARDRPMLAAAIGTGKESALAVERERADGSFDHVGVDLDAPVIDVNRLPNLTLYRRSILTPGAASRERACPL